VSDAQRQKQLLAALLVVLAGTVGYRVLGGVGGGGPGARAARPAAIERDLAAIEMQRLDLEALQREGAAYTPGRDPFRYGEAPAPPPPPPPPPKAPPRRADARPKAPPARPARATPEAPKPPAVDFVYLGSFGPQERRIAVFAKNDEIYNAFVGEVLLDRFIVDKIGFESADIKFVGFPDAPETRLQAGG